MSRFKTSKYRNAFPHIYKKEVGHYNLARALLSVNAYISTIFISAVIRQNWIHDLNVGSSLKYNNCHIKASCDYVAFIHDSSSEKPTIELENSSNHFFIALCTHIFCRCWQCRVVAHWQSWEKHKVSYNLRTLW